MILLALRRIQPNTYVERGKIFVKLENYSAALEDFTRAIELNPTNTVAYAERGKIYEELAIIPYNALIFFDRGMNSSWRKNFAAAAEDFSRAIDCDPTEMRFYFELGEAYRELKNYSAAIESYTNTLALAQKNTTFTMPVPLAIKNLATKKILKPTSTNTKN